MSEKKMTLDEELKDICDRMMALAQRVEMPIMLSVSKFWYGGEWRYSGNVSVFPNTQHDPQGDCDHLSCFFYELQMAEIMDRAVKLQNEGEREPLPFEQ